MGNHKSSGLNLTNEDLEVLARKTKFSQDEIIKVHDAFLKDCPSGKLDKKSFCKFYQSLFPYGDSTKFCTICFAAYDKDKSGFIDFHEYIYALSIITRGNIEEKLRLAFDIYDYNDDGFIEKKEAEKIINFDAKSLLQMYGDNSSIENTKKQVNKFMVMFDDDRNGLLSEKEFIDGCLRDKEMLKFLAPNC